MPLSQLKDPLQHVLRTAYLVGDFNGEHHKNDGFHEFSEAAKAAGNLSYDAFVGFFGIETDSLGKLNEDNPFFRFFKPYPPPEGPPPASSSEMATQVVEGLPALLEDLAGCLGNMGDLVGPATNALEDPDDATVILKFVEWFLADGGKVDDVAQSVVAKWGGGMAEKIGKLKGEIETEWPTGNRVDSSFATLVKEESLFAPLIDRYVFDVALGAVEAATRKYGEKVEQQHISLRSNATTIFKLENVTTTMQVLFALISGKQDAVPDGAFLVDGGRRQEARALWSDFVDGYKDLCRCQTVDPEPIIEEVEAKGMEKWNESYPGKSMPEHLKRMSKVRIQAGAGCGYLTEFEVQGLLEEAISNILVSSEESAQAGIATARSEGDTWLKELGRINSQKEHSERLTKWAEEELERDIETFGESKARQKADEVSAIVGALLNIATTQDGLRHDITSCLLLPAGEPGGKLDVAISNEQGAFRKCIDKWLSHAGAGQERRQAEQQSQDKGVALAREVDEGVVVETVSTDDGGHASVAQADLSANEMEDIDSRQGGGVTKAETMAEPQGTAAIPASSSGAAANDGQVAKFAKKVMDAPRGHEDDGSASVPPKNDGTQGIAEETPADIKPNEELKLLDSLLQKVGEINGSDKTERIREFHLALQSAFEVASKQGTMTDAQESVKRAVRQYLLTVMLVRHGIRYGDRTSGRLGWLLQLGKHGTSAALLQKVPLSSFIDVSSPSALHGQYNEMVLLSRKKVDASIPLLSKLYGVQTLTRSLAGCPDCRLLVWNGDPAKAIQSLQKDSCYDPTLMKDGAGRLPLCIYFADQHDKVLQNLPPNANQDGRPMAPCLLDAGPDYLKGSAWFDDETLKRGKPPYLSWVGPGLRYRSSPNSASSGQNNGRPTAPLIPAGFVALAAMLQGSSVGVPPSGSTAARFPQRDVLPTNNHVRFLLHHEFAPNTEDDIIIAAQRVLTNSRFFEDVIVWLSALAWHWAEKSNPANVSPADLKVNGIFHFDSVGLPPYAGRNTKSITVCVKGSAFTICMDNGAGAWEPIADLRTETSDYIQKLFI